MSWEEIATRTVVCPCGSGFISKTTYGDDWNRTEDGPVIIECDDCKAKYRIESESSFGYKPGRGSWTAYYLLPIDYPPYTGVREDAVFGNMTYNVFEQHVLESYSLADLKSAYAEYRAKRSSSKVTGTAEQIRDLHKRLCKSVKAATIIDKLDSIIQRYAAYQGTYDQRQPVREQEKRERSIYEQEKRKHRVRLDL